MANEISMTAGLKVAATNLSESYQPGTISIDFDVATDNPGAGGVQEIGTTYEAIISGDTTDGGVFFFRNTDETNYVEIGVEVAAAFYPFLKLRAGEFAVGRLSTATIYAKANAAAVNLQYRMLSP